MSTLQVTTIEPESGTVITLGSASHTIKIPGGGAGADKVLTSDADGDATWADAAGGGKILKVYEDNDNTTTSTTSTSYVASGLTITTDAPASTGSKFLLTLLGGAWGNTKDGKHSHCTFYVDGSEVADAGPYESKSENHNGAGYSGHSMACLHSPSTTSALTYTVYYKASANTTYFNWSTNRVVFTVMEIGA